MPERIHPQVTEAVSAASIKVVGESPAVAMASLYQTLGNSIALASLNAVYAQQQMNMAQQAATTNGVALLLSLGKSAPAE